MKIAAVIGHHKNSQGAWSPFLKKTEYAFNCEVCLNLPGTAEVFQRPDGNGYPDQMNKLAKLLNPQNFDLVIELHFNKYDNVANGKGHGVEVVAYPGSSSAIWGAKYCKAIAEEYGIFNRGVKYATEGGRGWHFLKTQRAPALILEPFFGDEEEAADFKDPARLAEVMDRIFCQ